MAGYRGLDVRHHTHELETHRSCFPMEHNVPHYINHAIKMHVADLHLQKKSRLQDLALVSNL